MIDKRGVSLVRTLLANHLNQAAILSVRVALKLLVLLRLLLCSLVLLPLRLRSL
jgi:hypothetical protein